MSEPVTVKIKPRHAFTVNAQGLVIIVFLILLACILLSGKSAEGKLEEDKIDETVISSPIPTTVVTPDSTSAITPVTDNDGLYEASASRRPTPSTPLKSNLRRRSTQKSPSSVSFSSTLESPKEDTTQRKERHPSLDSTRLDTLFQAGQLPAHIRDRLLQLEELASFDARKGALPTAKNIYNGSEVKDDPTKDGWDVVWGNLPAIGIDAANCVSAGITRAQVDDIVDLMNERSKASTKDKFRSISGFLGRTAPEDGGHLEPIRLVIGWFADTYRNVEWEKRMTIDNEAVNMAPKQPIVSRLLLWIEGLAKRLWRQRVFSTGADLYGSALRLTMPTTSSGTGYKYSLLLHIFLWGGPVKGGNESSDWLNRLANGAKSLSAVLEDLSEDYGAIEKCQPRRVYFRPGFTTFGINKGQDLKLVKQGVSSSEPMPRDAVHVAYPENLWDGFPIQMIAFDQTVSSILIRLFPQSAVCYNLRQHLWAKDTVTPENSRLDRNQLLAVLRAASRSMDRGIDDDATAAACHTISTLDLGGFLPYVGERFFPLEGFRALKTLVLPFTSASPSTPETLIKPEYGVSKHLTDIDKSFEVKVTCQNEAEVNLLIGGVTSLALMEAKRQLATTSKARARQMINAWRTRIYAVNLTEIDKSDGTTLQGERVGPEMADWPAEFKD